MRMIGIGGGEGGPADKAEANDEESAGGGPCARPTRGGKEARKKHEGGNEREAREDGGQQCADAEENHHAPLRDEGGGECPENARACEGAPGSEVAAGTAEDESSAERRDGEAGGRRCRSQGW